VSDDVALGLQRIDRGRTQIDRIASRGNRRKQSPVGRLDLHHMIQTGIVAVVPFSQSEVGPLARVSRDNVADDDRAMSSRGRDQCLVLRLGAEGGVNLEADAVEVAVDGWRIGSIAHASRSLHRTGMYALDADRLQRPP
jgi:ssDNA-binding replication factor A large subunit